MISLQLMTDEDDRLPLAFSADGSSQRALLLPAAVSTAVGSSRINSSTSRYNAFEDFKPLLLAHRQLLHLHKGIDVHMVARSHVRKAFRGGFQIQHCAVLRKAKHNVLNGGQVPVSA